MPLNLSVPSVTELKPKISVIGVGGAGGNAVNNMIDSQLDGVEFLVANTDAQAVSLSLAQKKIQLGTTVTQGLGAGSQPDVGRAAAEESLDEVMGHVDTSNMLFITAGMGGGTGTGAAPVIARAARERGILTVGVVTKPFHFEGARRMRLAEAGIIELQKYVDTLLIIPNQNLFRVADDNTTFADAFAMADEVLHSGVRGITDLMIVPGLINLDFADVRSVMSEMGKAMMGTGEAEGEKRAADAADAAISNPLLDEVSMKGARGVLINITGGMDMKLFEVDEAANRIRSEVDPEANIIVGSTFSHELEGRMRVSVVATGIEAGEVENAPSAQPVTVATNETGQAYTAAVPGLSHPKQAEVEAQSEDDTGELFVQPAAQEQTAPQPTVTAKESLTLRPAHDNPVGEVHDRIRKLLTDEDDKTSPVQLAEKLPQKPDANPFRSDKPAQPAKSPLKAAMDLFRSENPKADNEPIDSEEVMEKQTAPNLFDKSKTDEDLEIPAFLRRRNNR